MSGLLGRASCSAMRQASEAPSLQPGAPPVSSARSRRSSALTRGLRPPGRSPSGDSGSLSVSDA
eukprot:10638707-Lingulodinium_polyedra.AAC.1